METKLTVILKNNASVIQLVQDGPVPPVVPGLFLVLDFSLGLCLNLLLVITVASCPALRRLSFNRILLQLCVICALDCVLNLLAAVAFIILTHLEVPPKYGPVVSLACRTNAALTQWTTAIQSVTMAALAVDRAVTLRQADTPKPDPRNRLTKLLPVFMWLYGTVIVAPIVITSHFVGVRLFPDRYSCGIITQSNDPKEVLYPSLLLLLGYIIPWTIMLCISVTITRHVLSSRRRHLQLEEASLKRSQAMGTSGTLQNSFSYPTSWSTWLGANGPLSWEEVKFYLLSSLLLLLYSVLLVPHILCVNIPPLTVMDTATDNSDPNSSSMSELSAVLTGTYDCVFVWCRYKFTVVVPIVVIIIHKEVRKKCEHMFCCCCYQNSVVHLDSPRSISACLEKRELLSAQELNPQNKRVTRKIHPHKRDKYTRISHYTTPVLFATSEGLHLRYVEDRFEGSYCASEADIGVGDSARGKEQCRTVEPRLLCEFCDVALVMSTPTDAAGNPNPKDNVRRGLRLPVFGGQKIDEDDVHVSDDVGGDNGAFIRKREDYKQCLLSVNKKAKNENNYTDNTRATRVRFSQTVSEIPLSESGVWSATEDQVFVEQSALHIKGEPQNTALSQPKVTTQVSIPSRYSMAKKS